MYVDFYKFLKIKKVLIYNGWRGPVYKCSSELLKKREGECMKLMSQR